MPTRSDRPWIGYRTAPKKFWDSKTMNPSTWGCRIQLYMADLGYQKR